MVSRVNDALELLQTAAEPKLFTTLRRAVDAGVAEWRDDPIVPGVVGCVLAGTNRALVVVYVDQNDFEVDEQLLAEVAGR